MILLLNYFGPWQPTLHNIGSYAGLGCIIGYHHHYTFHWTSQHPNWCHLMVKVVSICRPNKNPHLCDLTPSNNGTIMHPSNFQHTTEKIEHSSRCCQNHHINFVERQHWHPSNTPSSYLRRFIPPAALASLFLLTGLITVVCLHDSHVSDWGLGEILPPSLESDWQQYGPQSKYRILYGRPCDLL